MYLHNYEFQNSIFLQRGLQAQLIFSMTWYKEDLRPHLKIMFTGVQKRYLHEEATELSVDYY